MQEMPSRSFVAKAVTSPKVRALAVPLAAARLLFDAVIVDAFNRHPLLRGRGRAMDQMKLVLPCFERLMCGRSLPEDQPILALRYDPKVRPHLRHALLVVGEAYYRVAWQQLNPSRDDGTYQRRLDALATRLDIEDWTPLQDNQLTLVANAAMARRHVVEQYSIDFALLLVSDWFYKHIRSKPCADAIRQLLLEGLPPHFAAVVSTPA